MARHIAKNLVAAGIADQALVQVAYAIGVAQPVGLFVDTYGTSKVAQNDGEIAQIIGKLFDMRPAAIIKKYGLKNPIFSETAAYGHMGRPCGTKTINGKTYETFLWEKLDMVKAIKKAFK